MNTANLVKIVKTPKKRLGQGHGSGRVKTSGRGQKGQKSRNKIAMTKYSGGSLAFVKRLPFLRGKEKNKAFKPVPVILNVGSLNNLPKNSKVDIKFLVEKKLVDVKDAKDGVKILGNGELTVPLTVMLPATKSAQEKIEKAGGTLALGNE